MRSFSGSLAIFLSLPLIEQSEITEPRGPGLNCAAEIQLLADEPTRIKLTAVYCFGHNRSLIGSIVSEGVVRSPRHQHAYDVSRRPSLYDYWLSRSSNPSAPNYRLISFLAQIL